MPTVNKSNAIAAALTAACDALFAMIENDPATLPAAECLILAMLHEAQTKNLCARIIIQRLHARLATYQRMAAGLAPTPTPRGPRHG